MKFPRVLIVLLLLCGLIPAAHAFSHGTIYRLPTDANGWYILPPPVTGNGGTCAGGTNDTCYGYVANNTTCVNAGTCTDNPAQCKLYEGPQTDTPATMCRTPNAGSQLYRNGKPDRVLFHRGDTFFSTGRAILNQARLGANSLAAPAVMGAYPTNPSVDDDRPVIDLWQQASGAGLGIAFQFQPVNQQYIILRSFRIINSVWDPTSPNYWQVAPGNTTPNLTAASSIIFLATRGMLVMEDLDLEGGAFGMQIDPGAPPWSRNTVIHRSVFHNEIARPNLAAPAMDKFYDFEMKENLWYHDYAENQYADVTPSSITASPGTPILITYAHNALTPTASGGLPPNGSFGNPPQVLIRGANLPVGATMTVSGAANNGSGLIRLTVNDTSAVATGDSVHVVNVGGVSAANDNWRITVIDLTHIDLIGSSFSGTYTSGGTAVDEVVPTTNNCTFAKRCYYLCNISGATANLSWDSNCANLAVASAAGTCVDCTTNWNDAGPNIFSHNSYGGVGTDDGVNPVFPTGPRYNLENNISAYASATGSQNRAGGRYWDNLYIQNPIGLNGAAWPSDIGFNTFMEMRNFNYPIFSGQIGWAINIGNNICTNPAGGWCTQQMVDYPMQPGVAGSTIHDNFIGPFFGVSNNAQAINLLGAQAGCNAPTSGHCPPTTGITVSRNVICDYPTFNNTPYWNQGTGNNIDNTNKPDPTVSNHDASCASLGLSPATVAQYYISVMGGPPGSTTKDFLDYCLKHWTIINLDTRCFAHNVNNFLRNSIGMSNPS